MRRKEKKRSRVVYIAIVAGGEWVEGLAYAVHAQRESATRQVTLSHA